MSLQNHFKDQLEKSLGKGFAGSRHVLAVSGGLDSMVLTDLAVATLDRAAWVVAHFDHGVREGSENDARFVEAYCRKQGLEFASSRGPGTHRDENTLRVQRREFLESVRRHRGAESILTAHHLDDQLETFFMRLLRGTGLDGLSGISSYSVPWVRPLLQVSRGELAAYAEEHQVRFRHDETNTDERYFRNRVRARLVPVVQELSQNHGGYERFLDRFAMLTRELEANELANLNQARSLAAHLLKEGPLWVRVDQNRLLDLGAYWGQRVLRLAVDSLGIEPLDRDTTRRLYDFLGSRTSQACFPGFRITQSCGWAYLQNREQSRRAQTPPRIRVGGHTLEVADLGLRVHSETGWESADTEVRFFRAGDRLGSRKLSDYFLEQRIPSPERRLLPLLAKRGESEVLWVFPQESGGIQIETCGFAFAASLKSL